MKIAVLGAGAFGIALGGILKKNKYKASYFDPNTKKTSLSSVLKDSEYLVLCVPSDPATKLLEKLPIDIPLIVATKGFLSEEPFSNFKNYMILSGPGFADDIKAKKETKLTVTNHKVAELFAADFITFDFTTDKLGVLICGALKNVYAIYAGMLGLKPGTKKHELYINSAAKELESILKANSARVETVDLACGRGDLEITCGPLSRNYEFGQMLCKNIHAKPKKTVEGVSAIKRIKDGEIIVPNSAKILKEMLRISSEWN